MVLQLRQLVKNYFEYIKEYVDGIITVSDYELMDAFLVLVEKHKLVAGENSGILSLAALKLNEKNKSLFHLYQVVTSMCFLSLL